MISNTMRTGLIEAILKKSVSNDIEIATKEWEVLGWQGMGDTRCECGQPIKRIFAIYNNKTDSIINEIGSTCIEKFKNEGMNITLHEIERFLKRYPNLAKYSFTVKQINEINETIRSLNYSNSRDYLNKNEDLQSQLDKLRYKYKNDTQALKDYIEKISNNELDIDELQRLITDSRESSQRIKEYEIKLTDMRNLIQSERREHKYEINQLDDVNQKLNQDIQWLNRNGYNNSLMPGVLKSLKDKKQVIKNQELEIQRLNDKINELTHS